MKKMWKIRRLARRFSFEKCGRLGAWRVVFPSKNVQIITFFLRKMCTTP